MSQFDDELHRSPEEVAATAAWRRAVEEDEGWKHLDPPMRLSPEHLEAIFQTTRGTLEDAGVPFLRANRLAERIREAVKEL